MMIPDFDGVLLAPAEAVAVPRREKDAMAALDAREAVFREAIWRGDELSAAVDAIKSELTALHRDLARAEETIAELTDIGDAAQIAIDRLRRDLAASDKAATAAIAQRDAVAVELFQLASRMVGSQEAIAQRDALAAEVLKLARHAERPRLRAFFFRLVDGFRRRR